MKKIIICNGNISIGGQEKMLIEFLNLLDLNKYEVLLLVEENNGIRNDYILDIPKNINYKFLTEEKFMMKIEKNQKSKNFIKKLIYSFLLKKKKKISINNLKNYLNFSNIIIDYDMGLLRNINKLELENKILVGWSHAGEGEKIKNKQKQKNLERYNYIVAINDKMKKGYENNTKKPKILKIYNFMDFEKIIKKSFEKVEENIGKYVLAVGALTENKNHFLLIEAFAKLKNQFEIEEKLVIIGEGKERNNLKNRIKELRMEKEIFLLGQKKNPYKYMKKAEIFILTSKNESFSLTTLESMVLGKMIISTKTNGTREILGENSEWGKLIENNNENELRETLIFYLNNEEERKKYEIKSVRRANDFKKEKIQKSIDDFLITL